jgi:hypothetical protein
LTFQPRDFVVNYLEQFLKKCYNNKLYVTIQGGGKSGAKRCVKLACKQLFAPDFTSEESPMLLVRRSRTRRCPALNSYSYIKFAEDRQDYMPEWEIKQGKSDGYIYEDET